MRLDRSNTGLPEARLTSKQVEKEEEEEDSYKEVHEGEKEIINDIPTKFTANETTKENSSLRKFLFSYLRALQDQDVQDSIQARASASTLIQTLFDVDKCTNRLEDGMLQEAVEYSSLNECTFFFSQQTSLLHRLFDLQWFSMDVNDPSHWDDLRFVSLMKHLNPSSLSRNRSTPPCCWFFLFFLLWVGLNISFLFVTVLNNAYYNLDNYNFQASFSGIFKQKERLMDIHLFLLILGLENVRSNFLSIQTTSDYWDVSLIFVLF